MFHLTRYKWIFFIISGVIIVPGILALIVWHLNLGIDFTNGTVVRLRFQNTTVKTTDIAKSFTKAGAQDVQVYASTNISGSGSTPATQYAYIQFSRPIGKTEEQAVLGLLRDAKYRLPDVQPIHTDYTTTNADGSQGAQMIVAFQAKVTTDQVTAALKSLPPTDAPPDLANTTGLATATPAATATTSSASAPTFPVSVKNISLGKNNQTYEIDTQTPLVNTPQAVKGKVNLDTIVTALSKQYGPVYVSEKSDVGPAIASETTISAIIAVAAASLAILIYIAITFRRVGSVLLAMRFGASAILALLHDALVVLGLWAIFGHFFNFKVDTLFLTAILTVIGFSVHDTIVVFDRIRENLARRTSETFDTVVNASLIQTMSRSLNTSLTVLLVLSAQVLFGGASTREFVLALLIGIASGTYSSIFNASMILDVWQNYVLRKRYGDRANAPTRASARVASVRA